MRDAAKIKEMSAVTSEAEKTLEYYMGLPYAVEIKNDEDGWFAKLPELPGCMTWAATLEDLGPMVEDAKRGYIEDALEHGDPVPEPRDLESYSGKVNLRMPRSLHRDLARRAEEEGVSLNQIMVAMLARSVGKPATTPEAGARLTRGILDRAAERAGLVVVDQAMDQASQAADQAVQAAGEVADEAAVQEVPTTSVERIDGPRPGEAAEVADREQ